MARKQLTILTINPGSTSTKVALFRDKTKQTQQNLEHAPEDLEQFGSIWAQLDFRQAAIEQFLDVHLTSDELLHGISARGGLFRPVPGGVYQVNQQMLNDAEVGYQGDHASNLGCALAHRIAGAYKIPAFVVDPVSTNEMEPIAKISGHPAIKRRSLSHALNIHYVARKIADHLNTPLENSRFIIAHLGGGISVAPVKNGQIIDVNDANNEGPFSVSRSGTLPPLTLSEWIINNGLSFADVRTELLKKSGLAGYLGTTDGREVERRIHAGDPDATNILNAMAYQIAKEIAAMSSVLTGQVDRIIITGGLAYLQTVITRIKERIEWIAPVEILEGEHEMEALAEGCYRVFTGQELAKHYPDGALLHD